MSPEISLNNGNELKLASFSKKHYSEVPGKTQQTEILRIDWISTNMEYCSFLGRSSVYIFCKIYLPVHRQGQRVVQ